MRAGVQTLVHTLLTMPPGTTSSTSMPETNGRVFIGPVSCPRGARLFPVSVPSTTSFRSASTASPASKRKSEHVSASASRTPTSADAATVPEVVGSS